ncbi:F-box LRR-repeat 14 [Chlorella sorokiniana]|uniref:F-box LRR-repeat 14 n=1 Tax=Chlorella sorokiniana TaxID=3076 RepID=A0A2P6TDY7_CHLSO|nr:F-box LRR-repeat 14 [Chlorella sorokiniana]|eukprot:PRW20854.1 F-box LRR-repeat 14 [Chlorella sorokiniana]
MDATPPSAWQGPPPFLAAHLLARLLGEPRWPLIVSSLRLISRGWRDALGEALPALAPPRYRPAEAAAAAAACFPGLRLLQLDTPAVDVAGAEARQAQQAAALAAICASCSGLRHLIIVGWSLPAGGLQPLASLAHLSRLDLCNMSLAGGSGGPALPPLPVRHLRALCPQVGVPELCRLTALTFLELSAAGRGPQLLLELAQHLLQLRRLVVADLAGEQCEQLPRLASLSTLSSLSLATSADTLGLPLEPLLALLSDSGCRLHQLALKAHYGFDRHLPLAALSGLESLALDTAEVQLAPPSCVSCLSRLTDLKMNVGAPLHQADSQEVDAFISTVGRRLMGLRRLALTAANHLSEAAMQHISGLTALTELSILDAHDFGGRALEALRPLTCLRRLSLSETSLNPVALAAVLNDEVEQSGDPLLPALTFLALHSCRLLSAPDVAGLATSLPSLRQLRLTGWPHMTLPALQHIFLHSPSLQLLQTDWRPPAAPHSTAGAEPDAHQQQELQRFEEAHALCRTRRLQLQHSLDQAVFEHAARFEAALTEAASEALPT